MGGSNFRASASASAVDGVVGADGAGGVTAVRGEAVSDGGPPFFG